MDPLKPIRKDLHNFLRKQIDKAAPDFQKGGKMHKLWSVFDGNETFMFKPNHVTHGGTHIKDGIDLKRTMFFVVLALIPCLLHGIMNVGHQHYAALNMYPGLGEGIIPKLLYGMWKVLPIVVVSYVVGLGIEFAIAQIKQHPISEGFLVSGMLIPLVMPPDIPLWMVAGATVFAVIIGKEAFGGTGMNIVNVALTARVFIFFAHPTAISGDAVWIAGQPEAEFLAGVDGITGATPLGIAATAISDAGATGLAAIQQAGYSFTDMFLGFMPGSIGETNKLVIALSGAFLIWTGIASWRIMVSVLVSALLMGYGLNLIYESFDGISPFLSVPGHYHLLMGGLMFGAVFMATDPVTACRTNTGKWIYGALIGVSAIIIRVLNPAYPEGVMLAILFANVFSPLIDHYVVQSNIKRRLARVKVG